MTRRENILHAIYVRMSRQGRGVLLRIRPHGIVAVFLTSCMLFLGADPSRSHTYQLFALMFGMLIAASISGGIFKIKGEAKRWVPSTAVPGQKFEIIYEVRNTGKKPWRSVRIVEIPPAPVPTLDEFISNPEPGEKKRNPFDRVFIYYRFSWLGERRMTHQLQQSEVFDLAPGEVKKLKLEIMPLRRGIMELRDLRLVKDDVFGFFRKLRRLEAEPSRVAVLPSPLARSLLPSQGKAPRPTMGGISPLHRSGQSEEFLTLRDYRPGDPLQHIHWAAFARAGHPVVREFEDVFLPRTALILDGILPTTGKAMELTRTFEAAVEAAASMAGLLQRGESLLELLLVQDRAHSFTSGAGHLQARRLLEVLASIQPVSSGSLDVLERLCLTHAVNCGSAHHIGLVWDDDRLRMLTRLRARGVSVSAWIIVPDSDDDEAIAAAMGAPSWVRIMPVSRILRRDSVEKNKQEEEAAA